MVLSGLTQVSLIEPSTVLSEELAIYKSVISDNMV
jgi:hypothetical protein